MVKTEQKDLIEEEREKEESEQAAEQLKASREVRSLKLIAEFEDGFAKDWAFPIAGNESITLIPGQFVTGRKRLAEDLSMSERNIRTCLQLLKRMGYLTITVTNKYSILTVVDWELYQKESGRTTSTRLAIFRQKTQIVENSTSKVTSKYSSSIPSGLAQCWQNVQGIKDSKGRGLSARWLRDPF